jgi:hypothetical protein
MPHVAHHGKDAVYGQQKTFATLGLAKVESSLRKGV